jgi:hypothetical protein
MSARTGRRAERAARAAMAAAAVTGLIAAATPAWAGGDAVVDATYSASLGGFGIASGSLSFTINGNGEYDATIGARVTGFAALVSSRSANASTSGRVAGATTQPRSYALDISGGPVPNVVRMLFSGNQVASVSATEFRSADPDLRIPLKPEHKRNVIDPLGAFVVSLAGKEKDTSPQQVCARTLKVFDGRIRYDLRLVYGAKTEVKLGGGSYSGPAVTCAVSYRPIAGYRPLSAEQQKFERNMEFSVTFAPVANTGVYLPVRVMIGTQMGLLSVVADRFVVRGERTAEVRGTGKTTETPLAAGN